jgi:transaldolase
MATTILQTTKMRATVDKGAEFWNDSCSVQELQEAVANGATGATSNPVIVYGVVKADPKTWQPVIDGLTVRHADATEDEIAWLLIEELGTRAAAVLAPVYKETAGRKGFLSIQVNPKFYRSASRMSEHGQKLAALAANVAIKVPATAAGLEAAEELVSRGINVNVTVSFTLPQAIAAAEALERGLDRAKAQGADMSRLHPYVTLMVGRLDDHLQRLLVKEAVAIEPGFLSWAGVAVFKKAYGIFQQRGYRSSLLSAAYRHHLHWSQLIGSGVVLSMPYAWWKQFEASDIPVEETLERPVEPRIVETLLRKFPDFARAYSEDGIAPGDFARYGASLHTLNQFLGGYQDLLGLVRERMVR